MNILVTGSHGYIGNRFCELFKTGQGITIVQFDTMIGLDIFDDRALENAVRKADVVINLAAMGDLYDVEREPERSRRINVDGAEKVARACLRYGKYLVHASTCCVYGNCKHDGIIDERTGPQPTELYAVQKLEAEKRLDALVGDGLRACIARLATCYGGNMRGSMVIQRFITNTKQGKLLEIHGTGDQKRTFTHVDDICSGLFSLGANPAPGIFNITSEQERSVNDIIAILERFLGKHLDRKFTIERSGQIYRQPISASKIYKHCGWKARITLDEGIKQELDRGTTD